MHSDFHARTLQITRPFGTVLAHGAALAVLLTILVAAFFETGSYAGFIQQVMPHPSLATSNPQFDLKIDRLDQWVRLNGAVDCIFIGSSQVDGGINPEAVSEAYKQKTGRPINCFNFGISTLTSQAAGPLAHLLVERYHPQLLVLGTSPRDFSEQFGDLSRPLTETAFIEQYNDKPSLQGWMIDQSSAYRYYLGLQQWQDPENRKIIDEYSRSIQSNGFDPKQGEYEFEADTQDVLIPDFEIHEADWSGFQELSEIKKYGIQVIVLEMPVHPLFLPFYLGSLSAYDVRFLQPIQSFLNHYEIPFWQTQPDAPLLLPGSAWKDQRHLNASGAEIFSRYLGTLIAERASGLAAEAH